MNPTGIFDQSEIAVVNGDRNLFLIVETAGEVMRWLGMV
jgi:hypothetical protein